MMAKPLLVLALAMVSGAAAAQPPSEQGPKPTTASDFVTAAHQSDEYEILAARVALLASRNPAVLAFAQHMIGDHQALSQALLQAAGRADIASPPPGIGADQARLLAALQSLGGPDFDRVYARQQVLAHDQALVVVEQGYAADGSDATIRAAARAAVPIIAQHLQMARQLAAETGAS